MPVKTPQHLGVGCRLRQARASALRMRVGVCASLPPRLDTALSSKGFGFSGTDFTLAVVGDLHLAPEQMHLFHQARDQLVASMTPLNSSTPLPGARLVQLGDLGHSKHASGSTSCFQYARQYLQSFNVPHTLVLGNHDLEGEEFPTDPDNLDGWSEVWQQPHCWAVDLGPARAVGLSTTRYRSNATSHHEVYIDDDQVAWFERQLQQAGQRPVLVFTHAPPQGCGLKVIQEVHVKNRCAWLNHSDRPGRFLDLVHRYPNIRLWFSGHFHLSHNYQDSISVVGSTAFVQTGVIGDCNRDGHRHSRLLRGSAAGWQLLTLDHDTGAERLDLQGGWRAGWPMERVLPPAALQQEAAEGGWLCSQLDCTVPGSMDVLADGAGGGPKLSRAARRAAPVRWFPAGPRCILALQGQLLVEYDIATSAPVGLVCKVPPGCDVRMVDRLGQPCCTDYSTDGSEAAAVEVLDKLTGGVSTYPRNAEGGFFVIFQPNKWKLKQAKLLAEREARVADLQQPQLQLAA